MPISATMARYSYNPYPFAKPAMPSPYQFDPPPLVQLFICPNCIKPMRIAVVESIDGRDVIKLTCEECGAETVQDHQFEQ